MISEAIKTLLPVLPTLIPEESQTGIVKTILDIAATLDTEEARTLPNLVNALLDELAFTDDTMSLIVDLLVGLLAGLGDDTMATIQTALKYVKNLLGIELGITPYDYKDSFLADYIGADVTEETTWADVAAKYTRYGYTYEVPAEEAGADPTKVEVYLTGENETTITIGEDTYSLTPLMKEVEKDDGTTESVRATKVDSKKSDYYDGFVWNVTGKETIIHNLSSLLEPVADLLKVVLQGRTFTLIRTGDKVTYQAIPADAEPVDGLPSGTDSGTDPGQDGTEIGNGYLEIRGSNGYSQALIPLLEAFGLRTADMKSQAQFNELDTVEAMLSYLVDEILLVVNNLAESPATFLATNLASVIYLLTRSRSSMNSRSTLTCSSLKTP